MAKRPPNEPGNGNATQNDQPYEVGYGRPPKQHQFRRGRSGNPGGRPKGSRNRPEGSELELERLKGLITKEGYRMIRVTEQGESREMPIIQAIIRSVTVAAANGDRRAQALLINQIGKVEEEEAKAAYDLIASVTEYQASARAELQHQRQAGQKGPGPIPHPDDIVIDTRTGIVRLKGPQTKEQYVRWASLRDRRKSAQDSIRELEALAARPENENIRQLILGDIAFEKKIADQIHAAIGDWDR